MPADPKRTGFWYRAAPFLVWCGVYLAHLAISEYVFITKLLEPVTHSSLDRTLVVYVAAPLAAYSLMLLTMIIGRLILLAIPEDKEKERRK